MSLQLKVVDGNLFLVPQEGPVTLNAQNVTMPNLVFENDSIEFNGFIFKVTKRPILVARKSFNNKFLDLLKNEKISEKIFSNLSLLEIKSIRLSCKKLKSMTNEIFVANTVLNLASEIQIFYKDHVNFRVGYSGNPVDNFQDEENILFLSSHGNKVKKLDLVIMPGRNDFAFINDCLSSLSNLRELQLNLVSNNSNYTDKYFSMDICIPSLKKLTLNYTFDELPVHLLKFTEVFLQAFPMLQSFSLACDENENELEEVAMKNIPNTCKEIVFDYVNSLVMDLLIDYPGKLTVAKFHIDREVIDTSRLQSFVDNHRDLKDLTLFIHGNVVGEPKVILPMMEKLENFSVTFYDCSLEVNDVDIFDFVGILEETFARLPNLKNFQANFNNASIFTLIFNVNKSYPKIKFKTNVENVSEICSRVFPSSQGQ